MNKKSIHKLLTVSLISLATLAGCREDNQAEVAVSKFEALKERISAELLSDDVKAILGPKSEENVVAFQSAINDFHLDATKLADACDDHDLKFIQLASDLSLEALEKFASKIKLLVRIEPKIGYKIIEQSKAIEEILESELDPVERQNQILDEIETLRAFVFDTSNSRPTSAISLFVSIAKFLFENESRIDDLLLADSELSRDCKVMITQTFEKLPEHFAGPSK